MRQVRLVPACPTFDLILIQAVSLPSFGAAFFNIQPVSALNSINNCSRFSGLPVFTYSSK